MLRFALIAAVVALVSSAPGVDPNTNIFKIDISPEEAASYLKSPPFTSPELSGRTAVLPLVRYDSPSFRAAEAGPSLGHYWKNGHEIENVEDYQDEVYTASQFHGQDGLGAYAYGYKAPESSKVENRERSGDVTGSYTYRAGSSDDLIKVRYWADSEGFHQEDNLPKVVLEPVQEAEDVRQARLAHEKAWQEAAAAAAQQPDPQGEYSEKYDEYESSASEPHNSIASAPGQPGREGKAYNQNNRPAQQYPQQGQYGQQQGQFGQQQQGQYGQQQGQFGQQQQGQYGQQQGQYGQQGQGHYNQQQGQRPQGQFSQHAGQHSQYASASSQYGSQANPGKPQQYANKDEEAEPTGPPRGFFYSFDYPVHIVVPKNGGQSGPTNPGQHIDHDTVGVSAHSQYSHYDTKSY